jgi:hypothetical protein
VGGGGSEDKKVIENEVQMRIFGPKRDELSRKFGKLQNEKLHNLCL